MIDSISIRALEARAEALRNEAEEIQLLIKLAQKYASSGPLLTAASALARVLPQPKNETKQQRILNATKAILSDGKRRLSRELIPELQKLGIDFSGSKNPKSLLSSYLSAAEGFVSDVKLGGWTLQSIAIKARPSEVAASPGLFSNGSEATHHVGYSARKEDAEFG